MIPLFVNLGFFDVLDILLVAFLLYQLYRLVKGTVAINIFVGVIIILLIWWVVELLNMDLLSTILGSVIGVGLLAVIILFQQEIRRFLLLLGTHDFFSRSYIFKKYFNQSYTLLSNDTIKNIVRACRNLSKEKTGALIVISSRSELLTYVQTGDYIDSVVHHRILETIFFKNSPMHDGAAIIIGDRIKAARCVLPIDDNITLPPHMGLRHRAAISMAMQTDTIIVTVSEETGKISFAKGRDLKTDLSHETLYTYLVKELMVVKPSV